MISKNKIKVLIVDDSALIRQTLTSIISSRSDMEVIATASDPYIAVNKMKTEKPDVITLDIQMPRMDGITFLKKIMKQHPLPVVVVSSIAQKESKLALEAYANGAIDVIEKPTLSSNLLLEEWRDTLIEAILSAANSRLPKFRMKSINVSKTKNNLAIKPVNKKQPCNSFVLIGSSAGGTEVILKILSQLEINTPPILIVQHMPEQFTASYADRLNNNSSLTVKEADTGDELYRGIALIAPGNKHLKLNNNGFNFFVELSSNDKVNRHRPSVDVLFESAIKYSSNNIMAIILSGMGNDGSAEMLKLKHEGAITIAQNDESCIVYGMPKEALRTGAADFSLSIEEIIDAIINFAKKY